MEVEGGEIEWEEKRERKRRENFKYIEFAFVTYLN